MPKKIFAFVWQVLSWPFRKAPKLSLDQIQKLQGYDNIVPYHDAVWHKEENVALAIRNREKFLIDGTTGKVLHNEKHYEFDNVEF